MQDDTRPASDSTKEEERLGSIAIEGYRILREIHRGGQGVVYKALQTATKRTVAVKVLLHGPFASERQRHRFEREIDLLAGLRHPNIVTLYDSGVTRDHRHFFVMEYVHGQPLGSYLADRPLSIDEMLFLFRDVCSAVNYAHQHGVIHRDLKPSNICVDSDGAPHVLDFGLAKAAGAARNAGGPLTITGEFMGTLAYASPEQTRGDAGRLDTRSDVYSLGVVLHEMLTGQLPYSVSGPIEHLVEAIRETPPRRPSTLRRGIDHDVDTIVLKALAKDKEQRYQSAGNFADDLGYYLNGEAIVAKRESIAYLVRRQLRHWVVRHRVGASLIATLIVFLMVTWCSERGSILRRIDEALSRTAQQATPEVWADDVVVLSFDDATRATIPALAESLELENVSADAPKSWRSLHGALMQRLAPARPKVVAWDIFFRTPEPRFDSELVAGIEALHETGAKVIVGIRDVDATGRPVLSPPIAARVDGWGWAQLRRDSAGLVRGVLLVEVRPPRSPAPSLSVAVFAAAQHAGFTPKFTWDGNERVSVEYSRRAPHNPRIIEARQLHDMLIVTEVEADWSKGVPDGMDCTHRYALYTHTLAPSPTILANHTVFYHSVFGMSDAQLRNRFEGKILFIGDNRSATTVRADRSRMATRDGAREEYHSYMHAASICDLLNKARVTRLTFGRRLAVLAVGCLGGMMLGWWIPARRAPYTCVAVGVILAAVSTVVAFRVAVGQRILLSPASLVLGAWLAMAVGMWVRAACKKHDQRTGRRPHPAVCA